MTDPTPSSPTERVQVRELRDEPFEPEVLSSDLVYKGWVWDVRSDRVAYGDGEIIREYVDHTGAVAVLALDDDGRVLLIQQYRHPIRHRDWELPAGLLDIEGEDLWLPRSASWPRRLTSSPATGSHSSRPGPPRVATTR